MKLQGYYKLLLITLFLFNSVVFFSQSSNFHYKITGVDNNSTPRPVVNFSITKDGKIISGKHLTILGKNHLAISKPIIIVEGIDFLNAQYFDAHIDLFNNDTYKNINNPNPHGLIYDLYENGYDVIILDFDNSTDYIQNNAMLLVKLINDIYTNNSLTEDNFVVMGYSMGGLIARYALTWMEANNQNHHTRLFVSHDAPQKGANFPLGLQELVQHVSSSVSFIWIAADLLLKYFNASVPAASQMLIYHYTTSGNQLAKPSNLANEFFAELNNLSPSTNGYPSKPLKIATSNGNYSGKTQTDVNGDLINAGDKILEFSYYKDNGTWQVCNLFGGCKTYKYAPDVIDITVRAGFDATQPLEKFNINFMGLNSIGNTGYKIWSSGSGKQTFLSNNIAYDIAPGSYSPYYMTAIQNAIQSALSVPVTAIDRTCFIPTVSALDLNTDIFESFNLNSSQCYTNFDYIHAEDTTNNDHFSLQQGAETFIMNHVLSNEKPRQKYYFSAENLTIPNNQIIGSGQSYNKTAKFNITNENSFIVNSRGSSTLIAGKSIEMKPGFTVESGGLLTAEIGYVDLMCENPVQFKARQLANGLVPVPDDSGIKNYDCSNVTEMPNYNSEFNYFDCEMPDILSPEVIDSTLNANISVYPNPTTGIMNIVFTDEMPINNLVINIFDCMNNLIYTINPVNTYSLNFNLPNCIPGLLTVQFTFNSPSYIFSKKVLKQ